MIKLIKGLVYLAFLAVGGLIGMLLSGRYIDYTITFDGIPASKLTESQIESIARRSATAIEQHTSVVIDGRAVVSFDGQWFMWLVVLTPVVLGGIVAFLVNRSLFSKRRP